MTAEHVRLEEARQQKAPWKKWGPYLSERQWGTVREDYSEGGDAWNYFSHDQARSRAYRWGEDGLAGVSDDQQRLCFALALWNGKDPILKERLFGLTNSESNHGEDVKEYYFYLDSTPTHSYMKYLYKYPQAAFPYAQPRRDQPRPQPDRVRVRAARHRRVRPEPLLRRLRGIRQGVPGRPAHPDQRPQPRPGGRPSSTSCRRCGSATSGPGTEPPSGRPCSRSSPAPRASVVQAVDPALGERYLYCEGDAPLLFTENETNTQRIFGVPNRTPYVKDSINDYVVHGRQEAVNPEKKGTKAAAALSPDRAARRMPGGSAPPQRRVAGRLRQGERPCRPARSAAAFDEVDEGPARRRPTSSTRRSSRRRSTPTRPTSCARPWPG